MDKGHFDSCNINELLCDCVCVCVSSNILSIDRIIIIIGILMKIDDGTRDEEVKRTDSILTGNAIRLHFCFFFLRCSINVTKRFRMSQPAVLCFLFLPFCSRTKSTYQELGGMRIYMLKIDMAECIGIKTFITITITTNKVP